MIVVGLMSGTSADGTDVAVVEIEGKPPALEWRLIGYLEVPHPSELRDAILKAMSPETGTVDLLCGLNVDLGGQFAAAALSGIKAAGLSPAQVDLIGSHGQTVWHAPERPFPATLQLGETAVIVERTGIPVVGNFRARDMAAGGQGAPLVAYVDTLLLTHPTKVRAAQNIGGIGNVTFIPPANRTDLTPFAFDTGPGNVLLDDAASRATNGAWTYDKSGQLAAQGQIDEPLLEWLMKRPYFQEPPPKTTGRELFSSTFAAEVWQRGLAAGLQPNDMLATLTAFTVQSIADAYRDFLPVLPDEVFVSGGGTRNETIMLGLKAALHSALVTTSDDVGIANEAKEAIIFAMLAYETWNGRSGNLPAATGARKPVVLGNITF